MRTSTYHLYLLTHASVMAGDGITPVADLAEQFLPKPTATGSYSAEQAAAPAPMPDDAALAIVIGTADGRSDKEVRTLAEFEAETERLLGGNTQPSGDRQ